MNKAKEFIKEEDPCWKGYKQIGMKNKGGKKVPNCVPESYDMWTEDGSFGYTMDGIVEAEYQGRKVKLGKGGTMRIRKSNPKARKAFRARHNCDSPGPRHKARYWSCRKW